MPTAYESEPVQENTPRPTLPPLDWLEERLRTGSIRR